jgi:hypothetical protein
MRSLNESLRRFAARGTPGHSAAFEHAEVLEWMGTAYGVRENIEPEAANVSNASRQMAWIPKLRSASNSLLAVLSGRVAPVWAFCSMPANRPAIAVAASVVLVAAIAVSAARSWMTLTPSTPPAAAASWKSSLSSPSAQDDLVARANREAQDAKEKLAAEQQERRASDRRMSELASLLEAEALARKHVEKASGELSFQLDAERKARRAAEQVSRLKSQELGQKVEPPSAAALTEERSAVAALAAPVPPIRIDGLPSGVATDLIEGQKLFAKGDLVAARKRFESVAAKGLPEGALAAGNTFDPVTLAKAGLTQPGDPVKARQWYRRAHELAQAKPREK